MKTPAFFLTVDLKRFCAVQTKPALDWLGAHLDGKTGDRNAHGGVFYN
jgi:hypothetical protein